MNITKIINSENPTLSFEVFPPKNDSVYESIALAVGEIASLKPSFMSVTYGAGGGTSGYTASIASNIQQKNHIPVLAHLSCINSTKSGVRAQLASLKEAGIRNILALRGDIEAGRAERGDWDYRYASQLVEEIQDYGDFCIGAACYPEGHLESNSQQEDIQYLKQKVDAGAEFLTTQMFFDNNILYNFLYKIKDAGIHVPVVAGIMPVTNIAQIKRIVELSGTVLPQRFKYILDKFGNDPATMRQAGIAYATEQIIDLYANGIKAVHVYTMNNPAIAQSIKNNISEIIK